MTAGLVGTGPAADAVEAALRDVGEATVEVDAEEVRSREPLDLVVATGRVDGPTLADVNAAATAAATPWIGVEVGGVGGYPVVEAAVSGFSPDTGCYECLRGRVAANVDPDHEPTAAPSTPMERYAGAVAGLAAARYCASGDDGLLGTVREVPHAERDLLPLPGCSCAGERDRALDLTARDRSLDAAIRRAERGLDERVGVVQQVGETESFPVPYYLARLCETAGFSDAIAARDAAGVALDWDAAFMKALGEAMERYCAGVYRTAELAEGPTAAVEGAVAPSAFVCREPPDDGATIRWVPGRNLATDEPAALPAALVYYPPPTERFRPPITTGLGLGSGGAEAVLAGLLETVERDAAVLAWYSTYEPLGLTVADEGYATLAARARSENLAVTPLLLTQDVDVPVVAAAVHREEWPRFALGTAADLDAGRAARRALAEALQNWTELRQMGPETAADAAGAIGRYADLPDAAADLAAPETEVPAETIGPADVPTGTDALEAVLSRLEDADLAAYAARTTTRDVAALGFEAVRVLVPAAQPLFFGEAYFGERAERVPRELGFEPAIDRDHHPYP